MGGAATVGRLVVTVTGDVDQLKIDMREAQAITGAATKEIVAGLHDVSDATDYRNTAGRRMIAAMQEEIKTFGMGADELKVYKASLLGVGDQAAAMVSRLNDMKAAQASFTQESAAATTALRAHGTAAREAGGHVDGFSFATAGAKRELLVLAHELSQGNYKKFGGSMLVLGEQTGAAGLLFSAAGIAAIGMGAAFIGAGLAAYHGAEAQREMNNALIMTGNYSGQTSDSLNALAHAAVASGGSLGEAKKAVTELAASGKFTGDQLTSITGAVVSLEHATGASIDETIKQFESLSVQAQGHSSRASTAISQATIKLDEQYHFLTLAVYDQITALEKEGELKEASKVATDAFAAATKERADEMVANLGNVASMWRKIKEEAGKAVDYIGDWGKKNTAAMDVARLTAGLQNPGMLPGVYNQETQTLAIAQAKRELSIAQAEVNRQDGIAASQAKVAMTNSQAVEGAQRIDSMLLRAQSKDQGALTTALKEYHDELDKLRAASTTEDADPRLSAKAVAAGEAALTKLHSQAVKGNDDRAKTLQDALLIEQTGLDREKSIFDARDKMLDTYHSKFGMSDDDYYAGRLTARTEYIAAEAITFAKEASLINGYKPKNAEEIATQKEKYDALLKLHLEFIDKMNASAGQDSVGALVDAKKAYDDLAKAINSAGNTEVKRLDEAIAKQREHNAEIGKSKEQIEFAKQAREDAGTVDMKVEADAINALLMQADLQGILSAKERELYSQRLAFLDIEIKKRTILSGLLATGASLEASAKGAEEASKAWKRTSDTIQNDLTSAILDGGGKGYKKLIRDMEMAFAKMILQPILAPISNGIASYINPLASQAQAGGVASANPLISAASTASSMYSAISGSISAGFSGISTSVADAVQAGMYQSGMTTQIASNGAVAEGAGAAAGYAGGIAAGKVIGGAISGQFEIGGHGSAIVNIGTIAGAVIGGPIGAAIGGAIGGLLNRAFGMGSEKVTGQSITGTLNSTGFTGTNNTAYHQDGGWFRSDFDGTHRTAVDSTAANALSTAYDQIKSASADFAKTLGVDASAIAGRSQDLNIAITSDSAANAKTISDFFVGVGDSIASELVPNLADFAKSGEAASATLQRLAGDFQATDALAAMMGKTALEAFGAIGIDSAAARERLIDLSGGIAALGSKAAAYQSAFLTEAEKIAPVISSVNAAMASLGLAGVTTKDQFKAVVNGLNLATEAGAQEYASLMALAPAFAQAADYADTLTQATLAKAAADQSAADALTASAAAANAASLKEQHALNIQLITSVAGAEAALAVTRQDALAALLSDAARVTQAQIWASDDANAAIAKAQAAAASQVANDATAAKAQRALDIQLMTAMGNAEGALSATRSDALAALLTDQARATQVQIWAAGDAAAAVAKAQTAAAASSAQISSFVNALAGTASTAKAAAQSLRDLNSALLVGSSSALSPEDQYNAAKQQLATATPANMQAAESTFLSASKAWFGGSAGYANDFAMVLAKNSAGASAQDAYAAAVPTMLKNLMANGVFAAIDGSHAGGLDYVPKDNYIARLHVGERVQTASAVKNGDAAAEKTNALLAQVIVHLQAVVAQGGTVGTGVIAGLTKLADKADATKRELARV